MARLETVPLTVRRGDTLELFVEYLDSNDVLVDVTGWSASFVVWLENERKYVGSTTSGDVTAGPSGYKVLVPGSATDTLPEKCWYEFRHRDLTGRIETLVDGSLTISAIFRDGAFVV